MIYLDNITTAQKVMIPLPGAMPEGELRLSVVSTVNRTTYDVDVSADPDTTSSLYSALAVILPDGLQDGSYEYTLTAGGAEISSGCMQIGEYISPYDEYYKNEEYRQYDGQ